jgi:hypothetical protein
MYYLTCYKGAKSVTASGIRSALVNAKVPKASSVNLSDVLAKLGPLGECIGRDGREYNWKLTDSGLRNVRSLLGIENEDVEADVSKLSTLINGMSNEDVKGYLEETLKCLQAGALRASVVFAWVGAAHVIREWVMAKGAAAVNAAVLRHYKDARAIRSTDDLEYLRESTLLLVAQDLGIFDKTQKDVLTNYCLDVRNQSGHPGKYWPGEKKVSAVLEDLIRIVYAKFY